MIFTMLVGAWFLIHQHCCFADAGSAKTIMVDPLMRRSPLEKNFIRFGRSWPHAPSLEPNHGSQLHGNDDSKSNMLPDTNDWDIGQRDIRGKENFIRFGRTIGSSTGMRTRDGEVNWDFALPPVPIQDGLTLTASDLDNLSTKFQFKFRDDNVMFPRMSRSNQNFIRFGRSNAILNKNKKYSGHNRDNFIRFGRKDSKNYNKEDSSFMPSVVVDEYDGLRETRDRGKEKGGKNSGFIRFGKSNDHSHFSEDRREKRSLPTGNGDRCDNSVSSCKSCFVGKTLDPTTLVAPEFSLLPKIPFQHTPLKKNFIRLG